MGCPGRLPLALAIAICYQLQLSGQIRSSASLNDLTAGQVDAFVLREVASRGIPGAVIGIVSLGQLKYAKAYGIANVEAGNSVTVESVFEIASLTKTFTAAAIMLLVEEGRIDLDAPITKYIPESPSTWSTRTVREILSHSAGFALDGIVRRDGAPLLTVSREIELQDAFQRPFVFDAAQDASYSDLGYFLLGIAVERASGRSYQEFMQERIFDPMQMKKTSVMDRLKLVPGRVPVYAARNGQLANWGRDWRYDLPSFFGIMSTVGDLARFDIALRSGKLLKSASMKEMWSPAKLGNGEEARVFGLPYGFGWMLGDNRGHRVAACEGASGTLILHFIDEDLSVIVLTNLGQPSRNNVGAIARGIAGIVRPEFQPPTMMATGIDPQPQLTAEITAAVRGMFSGTHSPTFIDGAEGSFASLPPQARSTLANQIGEIHQLEYIDRDMPADLTRRGVKIETILYYRHRTKNGVAYFTFWISTDSRVVDLQIYAA